MTGEPLGPLRRYEMKGLFGRRSLAFELDPDEPTIVTGANGTGKSTVLKTINAFGSGDWGSLLSLPFDEVTLTFGRRRTLGAKKTENSLTITGLGHKAWEYTGAPKGLRHAWKGRIPSAVTAELLAEGARSGVLRAYEDAFEQDIVFYGGSEAATPPQWVMDIPGRFPVLYVTDQRLVVEAGQAHRGRSEQPASRGREKLSTRAAVDDAARDIASRIRDSLSQYAIASQRLDRDFPQRVVKAMRSKKAIDDAELQALTESVEALRRELQNVGLLPSSVGPTRLEDFTRADHSIRAVIKAVAMDTREKLSVLEPLRVQLSLFIDFLRQHYQEKQVVIDQEHGFSILTDAAEPLPPSLLSSGEQQILVLAHHVIFKADTGTLVLIDEPELSLHVLWQDTLIDDLSRMGKPRDLRFLLATHSPTLVGGRTDLRRSLDTR